MIDIKPILRLPLRVRPTRIQLKLKRKQKQRIEKKFQQYLEETQKTIDYPSLFIRLLLGTPLVGCAGLVIMAACMLARGNTHGQG